MFRSDGRGCFCLSYVVRGVVLELFNSLQRRDFESGRIPCNRRLSCAFTSRDSPIESLHEFVQLANGSRPSLPARLFGVQIISYRRRHSMTSTADITAARADTVTARRREPWSRQMLGKAQDGPVGDEARV